MASNLMKNDYLHKFKEEDSEIEELSRIEENELLQSPKFKRLQSSSPPRSNSSSPQKHNLSTLNENTSFENRPILNYVPTDDIPKTPTKPKNRQNLKPRASASALSSSIKRVPPPRYTFNTPTKLQESNTSLFNTSAGQSSASKFPNSRVSLTPAQRFEKKPGKLFSSKDILSAYEFKETIGRGAFANVYRAINKITGDEVAIKEIFIEDDDDILELMCEIDLLKILKHRNIVKYHGFIKNEKKLLIFLEYCSGGSLRTLYKKQGPLSEKQVAKYLIQVLEGLKYLHSQGVVHRDVKAANILLTSKGDIKLTDFGVSTKVSTKTIKTYSIAGTPNWMAPEIISMDGTSTASDIWSLGATIVELLTGEPLYAHLNEMAALHAIVTDEYPPIPTFISDLCKDFIMKCFEKQPTQRITAEELFDQPWLVKLTKKHKSKTSSNGSTTSSDISLKKKVSNSSFNDFNSIKRFNTKNFLPLDLNTFKHSEQDINTLIDNKLSIEFDSLNLNGTSSALSSPTTATGQSPVLFRPLEQNSSVLSAQKLKKKLQTNPLDTLTLKDIIRKLDNDTIDLSELVKNGFIYSLGFTINQNINEYDVVFEIISVLSQLVIKQPEYASQVVNSGVLGCSKQLLYKETPQKSRNKVVDFLSTMFDVHEDSLLVFIQSGGFFESLNLLEEDFKSDPKLPIFTIRTIRKAFQTSNVPKDLILFAIFNTPNTIDWIGIFLMAFAQSNNTSAINDVVSIISELEPSDSSLFKPIFLNSIFKMHDRLSITNQSKILKFLKTLNLNEISKQCNILKFLVSSLEKNLKSKTLRLEFLNLICSMIFSCCHLNPEKQVSLIKLEAFPLFQDLIGSTLPCSEFIIPLVCELPFNQSLMKFLKNQKTTILGLLSQLLIDPVWQANALDALVALHECLGHDESIMNYLLKDSHEFLLKSFLIDSSLNFELYLEKLVKLLNTYNNSKVINEIRLTFFRNSEIIYKIFEKIETFKFDLVVRLNLFKLLKILVARNQNQQNFEIVKKHLDEIRPTRTLLIDKLIDEIFQHAI